MSVNNDQPSAGRLDASEAFALAEPYLLGRLASEKEDAFIEALYEHQDLYVRVEECKETLMIRYLQGDLDLTQTPSLGIRWRDAAKLQRLSELEGLRSLKAQSERTPINWRLILAAAMVTVVVGLGTFAGSNLRQISALRTRLNQAESVIRELRAENAGLERKSLVEGARQAEVPPGQRPSPRLRQPSRDALAGVPVGNSLPSKAAFGASQQIAPQEALYWLPFDRRPFGGSLRPEDFQASIQTSLDGAESTPVKLSLDRDGLKFELPTTRFPVWLTLTYKIKTRVLDHLKLLTQLDSSTPR